MILTVDIGNTNIDFAVFKGSKMLIRFHSPTIKNISRFDSVIFKRGFKKGNLLPRLINGVIICSVVPKATVVLTRAIQSLLKIKPLIVGKDIIVPIKNNYKIPSQVGQDRLVAAFAASKLYGFPVIVVDFGTATTIDVVSRKDEYSGGIILPGITMFLSALHEKTALLPEVKFKKPGSIIGRDTKESILSGIYYGLGSLIDGLLERIFKQLKQGFPVIFIGGFARSIAGSCRHMTKIDTDLILKGLQLVHLQTFKKRIPPS